MTGHAISLTLDGTPDLPSAVLQSLYRITGRSTVELRRAILAGDALYAASLFGPEHIDVVPRLEKTIAFLTDTGLGFTLSESFESTDAPISLATLREILEVPNA